MMATMDGRLNQWLRDAHAMEVQAAHILAAQSKRMQNYPELRARVEQHRQETDAQRQRLETRLKHRARLSSGIGKVPDRASANAIKAMGADEIVKFAIDCYASKHREIATYRALLVAAEVVGDADTARVCEEALWEEDAMAAWLRVTLPELSRDYLAQDEHRVPRRQDSARGHPHH
jgi:ferritin-like metal-binding protein YciE